MLIDFLSIDSYKGGVAMVYITFMKHLASDPGDISLLEKIIGCTTEHCLSTNQYKTLT